MFGDRLNVKFSEIKDVELDLLNVYGARDIKNI